MAFTDLMRSADPEHIAEFQWRLGIPLSTIILAILAVPLSRSQPRAGRYGRLAIGLLVFIIYLNMLSAAKAWIEQSTYLNMLSAAKAWIEQSTISPALGLWWVHATMFLFAMVLLAVQNGYHRRLFR